ncbi:MAG: hypothetical protein ACI8PZ_002077 [Myxococcota bacterium]|jgi:hypothetical protein
MPASPTLDPEDLPSLQELRRATVGAVVVAAVLVTTVVLPAEWGIDPTGVGEQLGLTAMGNLKTAGADTTPPPSDALFAFHNDTLQLTLKPGEGAEIKAVMRKGDALIYTWAADRGELYFDFHGEPKGAASDVFTSFERDTKSLANGAFEAPFDGTHGWYWKNKSGVPVTVELTTSGVYQSIGRK